MWVVTIYFTSSHDSLTVQFAGSRDRAALAQEGFQSAEVYLCVWWVGLTFDRPRFLICEGQLHLAAERKLLHSVTPERRVARLADMQAHSSGEVYRQLFSRIIKEQLPWASGRTITPKCRFSVGSFGRRNALSGSKENSVVSTSMGSGGLWRKLGLNTRGVDLVMVRRAEGLGGLRHMGIIERPAGRAAQHGVRTTLPTSDEEKHTDEFLKEEKRKQAAKVMKTEQVVGGVAGQSLAATDAEFFQHPGRNTADTQKDIAEEMTRKSESGSRQHMDANIEHPDVDEEVKRGLVADSALPMGRTETKVDEDDVQSAFKEDEHEAAFKVDILEHGSFKTL